ncbi:ATP-binding protein [Halochromatium roseum]|uniref:ATP-binding protein n=1 Tax=Halochromatium roseum TaxID=391920 RepID=UPI0019126E22|nr:ATP-binding protein [Halochromatium roseum]
MTTDGLELGQQDRAEAARQRGAEMAQVDTTPVLVARITPVLRYSFNNAAYANWFGVQPEVLLGTPVRELVGEAAFEILREPLRQSLAGEVVRFDAWLPLSVVGRRYCRIECIPDQRQDGDTIGLFALITDLTPEASLREQARGLEVAGQHRNELLSRIGHELRNPLTSVRNVLDRLLLGDANPVAHARALRLIDRQLRHMERLVRDLLDVARIRRGSIELIMAPRDLRELVQESLQAMEAVIREHRHQVQVELPDAPVMVCADETRLVQVVSNLLDNAVKYTDDGGHISVRLRSDEDIARLQIEDSGCGIEADAITGLFDAYRQAPRALHRADGGLGLGLTLVKQLVELQGGQVEARSDGPQCGSLFEVYLPVMSEQAKQPRQPAAIAALHTGSAPGLRVLVVDDNAEVVKSMIQLLTLMGYQANGVSNGSDALATIAVAPPDLVLLDIGLPEMDGIEVARRLSAMAARASLKLVAMSGYAPGTLGDAAALFDAHLLKPAGRDALGALLSSEGRKPGLDS